MRNGAHLAARRIDSNAIAKAILGEKGPQSLNFICSQFSEIHNTALSSFALCIERESKRMRRWIGLAAMTMAIGLTGPANATGTVPWSKITSLSGGWIVPMFAVTTSAPTTNPDSCPATGIYTVPATAQAHDMFISMLLTAYARGDEVELTIDGCQTWPVIIGMRVRPAQ